MAPRLVNTPPPEPAPRPGIRREALVPRSRAVLGGAVAMLIARANADRLESTDAAVTRSHSPSPPTEHLFPAPDHHAEDVRSAVLRHGQRAVIMALTFAQFRRYLFSASHRRVARWQRDAHLLC